MTITHPPPTVEEADGNILRRCGDKHDLCHLGYVFRQRYIFVGRPVDGSEAIYVPLSSGKRSNNSVALVAIMVTSMMSMLAPAWA